MSVRLLSIMRHRLTSVLVVDARSAAYSMAALLKGFVSFRPDFRLLGVVLNKVGSPRHAQMLREVCADVGVPCLGCLPRNAAIGTQERYLGLDFSDGTMSGFVQLDTIADFMEQHLDLSFLELLLKGRSENVANAGEMPYCNRKTGYGRVAVARSPEAFSFIYQSTLDCLSDSEVVFFNPEADEPVGFSPMKVSGRCAECCLTQCRHVKLTATFLLAIGVGKSVAGNTEGMSSIILSS